MAGAAIAGAAFFALAPAASAHVDPPTVTALHAFIGDPLFGLNTPAGTLFGIAPDERTAMASTTKVWTLDVTVHALDAGCVQLDDDVVINAFEAGIGGSSMTDVNGVPLETGEVVKLEDLIRGMMYPSGNNATYAIARHVAESCLGAASTWQDFVNVMNQHALDVGLTDTHFENPNGFDGPTHYTTARELAEQFEHGLESPYFAQVVGFKGTWNATTQGPNGPKNYTFSPGRNYPGWEGEKNGITPNCNGPANGCIVMAATRIGRRVIVATMQGTRGQEEPGMLDYGFAQIFHPDPRGSSASVGAAIRHDTLCLSDSRCVSAVLPGNGDVKLVSWQPGVDGSSIGILDQKSLPGSALPPKGGNGNGPSGDVALTELPSGAIVAANRKGSSVELSRWSMDGSGSLSLLASGIKLGPATTIDLQPVYGDMLLSAVTDPDGSLVLKSWKLDGSSLVKLGTYRDASRAYSEVSTAGPLTTDVINGHRAVTAAIAPGLLVHDVWGVDPTSGVISRLGELAEPGTRDNVEIAPFSVNATSAGELFTPTYYVTALRYSGGYALFFYRIDAGGTPVDEGAISTFVPVSDVGIAPLGVGGVMSASLQANGTVELRAWDARRNADNTISPAQISQHTAPDAVSLDLTQVPSTHAEGDYVTAVTDVLSGELRLRAYRSGDRPY